MNLDEQKSKFQALNNWFSTEQGLNVANAFSQKLTSLRDFLYGETIIQLGGLNNKSLMNNLRFTHKWLASPEVLPNSTLITLLNQLPLDRDSVSCIIAPLTMEAFSSVKNPIDEMDRVLKPMGYIVFLGVNPWSFWGGWLRFASESCFGPAKSKPKSVLSIKRAMLNRGYIQCHLSGFYYIPPVKNKRWIKKFEIFNIMAKMLSPIPAGFYCLVVQKYQENTISLTPAPIDEKYRPSIITPLQPICRETRILK